VSCTVFGEFWEELIGCLSGVQEEREANFSRLFERMELSKKEGTNLVKK
jgi:hypothetical protein